MLSILVWVMAATAVWHFSVLVPDHFYRGIIGSLVAANAGALIFGFAASGLVVPQTTGHADAVGGLIGGVTGLALSWLVGTRYDPVRRDW